MALPRHRQRDPAQSARPSRHDSPPLVVARRFDGIADNLWRGPESRLTDHPNAPHVVRWLFGDRTMPPSGGTDRTWGTSTNLRISGPTRQSRCRAPLGQAGTVTFLFTDIEGSTTLWEQHPEAMDRALRRHDDLLRDAISRHDGVVFATAGDGLAAAFSHADDALAAALASQACLRAEGWPEGVEIRVRMGLHSGRAVERDGDYFGQPVNRAARLMGAAHGGQVVLSDLVAEEVEPPPDVKLIDLGHHQLRGLSELMRVFGVCSDDVEWPDRPLVSGQSKVGNLPDRSDRVGGSCRPAAPSSETDRPTATRHVDRRRRRREDTSSDRAWLAVGRQVPRRRVDRRPRADRRAERRDLSRRLLAWHRSPCRTHNA